MGAAIRKGIETMTDSTQTLESVYMTSNQVCELFHVTNKTVYRWRKVGRLKGQKAGRSYLYKTSDVLALLEESNEPEKSL